MKKNKSNKVNLKNLSTLILCLSFIFFTEKVFAEIEIPTEELARESVLPKFDNIIAVQGRNVITAKKIEVVGLIGFNFSEAIQSQTKLGLNVGYHFSEASDVMINFSSWISGLSTYAQQMKSDPTMNLDFSRAPKSTYTLWGNYELKSFYGKISLTKNGIMNISLYEIVGLGINAYEHKNYYGVNAGLGCKFYINPTWALRTDFKFQYAQGPSPFLMGKMQPSQPVPVANEFMEQTYFSTMLDVGLAAQF